MGLTEDVIGRLIDLTGITFGNLRVIERTDKKDKFNNYFWVCECVCGNICEVRGNYLRRGTKESCGCIKKTRKALDITGKKFGKFVVEGKSYKSGYWACRCECGQLRNICVTDLVKGRKTACNCIRKEKIRSIAAELVGKKFGRLLVVELLNKKDKYGYYLYLCECECGNECECNCSSLKRGSKKSCGCLWRRGGYNKEVV